MAPSTCAIQYAGSSTHRKPARRPPTEVAETIEIFDIDPHKTSIAFRDAGGHFREVSMKAPHPDGRRDDFKQGDMVEVVYREGLAAALDPQ